MLLIFLILKKISWKFPFKPSKRHLSIRKKSSFSTLSKFGFFRTSLVSIFSMVFAFAYHMYIHLDWLGRVLGILIRMNVFNIFLFELLHDFDKHDAQKKTCWRFCRIWCIVLLLRNESHRISKSLNKFSAHIIQDSLSVAVWYSSDCRNN